MREPRLWLREFGDTPHHHHRMFRDHRWAVAAAAAMYSLAVALMVIMVEPFRDVVQPIDDWWLDVMIAVESEPQTVIAKVFDVLGSALVTIPVRVVAAGWLVAKRRWAALTTWLVMIAASEIITTLGKELYGRERPPDGLVDANSFAFPSGHSVATAVTAIGLVIILLPPGEHRRVWEIRAGVLAFLMAMSRTYLRVHWLSDVVTGVLLGAATALGSAALVQVWRARRLEAAEAAPGRDPDAPGRGESRVP